MKYSTVEIIRRIEMREASRHEYNLESYKGTVRVSGKLSSAIRRARRLHKTLAPSYGAVDIKVPVKETVIASISVDGKLQWPEC